MGASGLGALLVKEGFLTEQDRVTITKTCGQGSWAFAKCILSTGLLDEDELSAFFAERTKYVVAPKNLLDRLDAAILDQIDRRMVSRLEVLPLEIDHHKITVAVADPLDKSTIKQLEFFTGLEVVSVIAPLSQIHEGLSRLNPEFKPRPTALSNFLRNHAGAAWIKQKIVDEGDVDVPHDKRGARAAVVEDYDEEQVEDVSLDDEIDALEDSGDSLSDIDAGGLDEGIGNSDFDDIELEDDGSDLELTPGEDPDEGGEAIDDAGLDLDDPFDNFEDAPKPSKVVAAPSDEDLDGLESGGGADGDLWPDADDAPLAAAPKQAAAADDLLDESADLDGLGFEDEPKAKAAADDDFGLSDESDEPKPAKAAFDASALEDLDDEPKAAKADFDASALDDLALDDEPKAKADADDFGGLDDLALDDDAAAKTSDSLDDDFNLNADLAAEDIDARLDEPAPPSKAGGDLLAFPNQRKAESTRISEKPRPMARTHDAVEFAAHEETSASLRKAVHEDGVLPEFTDPRVDGVKEDTRIDLKAGIDDNEEVSFHEEDTSIELHAAKEDAPQLENLAMGFDDEDAIDEPAAPAAKPAAAAKPVNAKAAAEKPAAAVKPRVAEPRAPKPAAAKSIAAKPDTKSIPSEPMIDDFGEAEWNDIPIDEPAPARAGGRSPSPVMDNGSVASLTATAKANEALLRMSLCFDRSSALAIAREYLPQISGTGCLIDLGKTAEHLATWRSGAQSTTQGKGARTIQTMAKAAKPGQWSQVAVNASDELFGSVQSVSVYSIQKADGRTLLLAGDYPIEDETLREALTSFAEQLGAK